MRRRLPLSQMNTLEERAWQQHGEAVDVLAGYPEGISPAWVRELQQHPPEGFLSVAPSVYEQRIRDWFTRFFGAQHMRLTDSATMAFAIIAEAATPRGGEWVLQAASFDPWPMLLHRSGARVRYAPRDADGPDPAAIAAACTHRTCAVLIVCPDNPLGTVTSHARLEEIARLCRQRDIVLVTDHTLAPVNPLGYSIPLLPSMTRATAGLHWAAIGDTGKLLDLAGTKLGALMHSPSLQGHVDAAASAWGFMHSQYTLAVISEILGDSRFDVRQVSRQVAAHYMYLLDSLDPDGGIRTETAPPGLRISLEAGPFMLADAAGLGMSDIEYATLLRDKYSVLTLPLSWFPAVQQPETRVRISLARPAEVIEKLAAALADSAKTPRAA